MLMHRSLPSWCALASFAFPAPSLSASTYVVDDDGGPDVGFLDLPAAVTAAQPGDVLLVRAGSYSSFTLEKGIVILGEAGVEVGADTVFQNLPAGEQLVLADASLERLLVQDCSGTVQLDSVVVYTYADPVHDEALLVADSVDVRLFDCILRGGFGADEPALRAVRSRIEFARSTAHGGGWFGGCEFMPDGSPGLDISDGVRLHVVHSEPRGGAGSEPDDCGDTCFASDGGPAIRAEDSELIVAGASIDKIRGGPGGLGDPCPNGIAGDPLVRTTTMARLSGATFIDSSGSEIVFTPDAETTVPSPPDPYLEIFRAPRGGAEVLFLIHGPPGANVRLFFGDPIVQPGVPFLEQLNTRTMSLAPGFMPPSGVMTLPYTLPSGSPGTTTWTQAELVLSGTALPTNSVPVVYREADVPGEEFLQARFDFEAGGDQGWALGSPNNAATGAWTRVDPNGTNAQPEDDHTEAPGTLCWVTGQGTVGGADGAADVDGGETTLVSPIFDLANRTEPRVRYWRWYSNNEGASPNDDELEIDLSNDGGSTWVNAETIGPYGPECTGGWFLADIPVESILPPTSQMRLRVVASDHAPGSLVEAALDDFEVVYFEGGLGVRTCSPAVPNSTGEPGRMLVIGSALVGDDDLVLTATHLPTQSNIGYFLMGTGTNTFTPPGSAGPICVAPGIQRYLPPVENTTELVGGFTRDVGTSGPVSGQIATGSTWNFQAWHRDSAAGSSNLTDAVSVSFL